MFSVLLRHFFQSAIYWGLHAFIDSCTANHAASHISSFELVFCKRSYFSIHFPFSYYVSSSNLYWLCHHVMGLSPSQSPWNYSFKLCDKKPRQLCREHKNHTSFIITPSWIITLNFMIFLLIQLFEAVTINFFFPKCCWTLINRML